jgi:hypothetical protein
VGIALAGLLAALLVAGGLIAAVILMRSGSDTDEPAKTIELNEPATEIAPASPALPSETVAATPPAAAPMTPRQVPATRSTSSKTPSSPSAATTATPTSTAPAQPNPTATSTSTSPAATGTAPAGTRRRRPKGVEI